MTKSDVESSSSHGDGALAAQQRHHRGAPAVLVGRAHLRGGGVSSPQVVLAVSALCCLVAVLCYVLASTKFSSLPEVARSGACVQTLPPAAEAMAEPPPLQNQSSSNNMSGGNRTGSGGDGVVGHQGNPQTSEARVQPPLPRMVHIHSVVLGDSLVGATPTAPAAPAGGGGGGATSFRGSSFDGFGVSGTTAADLLDEMLQSTLVGRHIERQGQLQPLVHVLEKRLEQEEALGSSSWSDLIANGRAALRPKEEREQLPCSRDGYTAATGDNKTLTEGLCIVSASSSLFSLPGHNTAMFGSVLEGCISGQLLASHVTCAAFMASIQSGLLVASAGNVDEVLFVVYASIGVNNALLFPGAWSPAFEAQRVTSLVELLVNQLVGRSTSLAQDRSAMKRPAFVGAVEWRKQLRMVSEWDRATNAKHVGPLFPFSYSGKRRVLVVGAQIPHVWFYNNATSNYGGGATLSTQQPPQAPSPWPAAEKDAAGWLSQLQVGSSNNKGAAAFTFPPAAELCNRRNGSTTASLLFVESWCYSVCWMFTAMYEMRQRGVKDVALMEHMLAMQYGAWKDRLSKRAVNSDHGRLPEIVVSKELLPLRWLLSGDCGSQCGTADWLRTHPERKRNVHDCVHVSLEGARRVPAMLLRSILRLGLFA